MDNDRSSADRGDAIESEIADTASASPSGNPPLDPNDEVPVPIAMYPSEIDERAQVVEALREETNANRADDLGLTP